MRKRNGYVRVSLEVSEEYFAFAAEMAEAFELPGPRQYLNALLNGALAQEAKEHERVLPPPLPLIVLMPADDKSGPARDTDLDDEIPL